jgi:putative membrane protein
VPPANDSPKATGDSPFRDHAANERTMLAWIRTGIALMAFGFAIARFGLFLREVAQVGQVHEGAVHGLGSSWFGVALVVLGLATNAAAVGRYARIRKALEKGDSFAPSPALAYGLGAGSVVVAIAMAIMLASTLRE